MSMHAHACARARGSRATEALQSNATKLFPPPSRELHREVTRLVRFQVIRKCPRHHRPGPPGPRRPRPRPRPRPSGPYRRRSLLLHAVSATWPLMLPPQRDPPPLLTPFKANPDCLSRPPQRFQVIRKCSSHHRPGPSGPRRPRPRPRPYRRRSLLLHAVSATWPLMLPPQRDPPPYWMRSPNIYLMVFRLNIDGTQLKTRKKSVIGRDAQILQPKIMNAVQRRKQILAKLLWMEIFRIIRNFLPKQLNFSWILMRG